VVTKVKFTIWEQFKVDQKNVVKNIFQEHNSDVIKEKKEIAKLLGGDRNTVEENVKELSELFESWENKIDEDCYGSKLFAIPLPIVLKAIKKDNAKELLNNGDTYRRFDIAIALIESLLKAFPPREVEEGEHDWNLYCVLWGY